MSPEEFIKKHITTALVAEGFPEQVASGGGWSALTTTAACLRRAVKDALTTTVCSMHVSGRWDRQRLLSANRQKSREEVRSPACSDFAIQYQSETCPPEERFHEETYQ